MLHDVVRSFWEKQVGRCQGPPWHAHLPGYSRSHPLLTIFQLSTVGSTKALAENKKATNKRHVALFGLYSSRKGSGIVQLLLSKKDGRDSRRIFWHRTSSRPGLSDTSLRNWTFTTTCVCFSLGSFASPPFRTMATRVETPTRSSTKLNMCRTYWRENNMIVTSDASAAACEKRKIAFQCFGKSREEEFRLFLDLDSHPASVVVAINSKLPGKSRPSWKKGAKETTVSVTDQSLLSRTWELNASDLSWAGVTRATRRPRTWIGNAWIVPH